MAAQERLETILREEQFRAFAPFGAADPGASGTPCVCFSESPPEHLDHLIQFGRFTPWALVTTRMVLNKLGGGSVAYVPPNVQSQLQRARLGHWAVRTDESVSWMHEREWRLPLEKGTIHIAGLAAILVGDAAWRPQKVATAWVDGSTGDPLPGPDGNPYAQPLEDYPRLWRETPVWVWDHQTRRVAAYEPGELG
jgi:hypothetical protein